MQNLNKTTITQLNALAEKYETHSFINEDPSQFLYKFQNQADTEIISFIAAMLSFGKRDQFIKKINYIVEKSESSPHQWIKNKHYLENFIEIDKTTSSTFYRFYTNQDMLTFFQELSEILENYQTFGDFIKAKYQKNPKAYLDQLISESFPKSKIVPKGKNSPNKRIQMFLRWMVRENSPVDKGFWTWYPKEKLIIPLDTHVLQQSKKLGIIPEKANATRKTALVITEVLTSIFPGDPVKGDFALFGLGVNSSQQKN